MGGDLPLVCFLPQRSFELLALQSQLSPDQMIRLLKKHRVYLGPASGEGPRRSHRRCIWGRRRRSGGGAIDTDRIEVGLASAPAEVLVDLGSGQQSWRRRLIRGRSEFCGQMGREFNLGMLPSKHLVPELDDFPTLLEFKVLLLCQCSRYILLGGRAARATRWGKRDGRYPARSHGRLGSGKHDRSGSGEEWGLRVKRAFAGVTIRCFNETKDTIAAGMGDEYHARRWCQPAYGVLRKSWVSGRECPVVDEEASRHGFEDGTILECGFCDDLQAPANHHCGAVGLQGPTPLSDYVSIFPSSSQNSSRFESPDEFIFERESRKSV